MSNSSIEEKAINTIRFLAADAVQAANSGHPGLPMGMASAAYVLWTRHLKFNPDAPAWPDRDRFVLSAGHGSMLLYAMLHLTGYDLPMKELKDFRQLGSKTPGHPEYGDTPGVETTTGPLGQGFANGVGMGIAAHHLQALYNRPEYPVVDHFIYAIVSDGDLMEGVASEAASLAGHLQLGRLIYIYDDNRISIDGSTELAFTEDRSARFKAYGWHVQRVENGNDLDGIDAALSNAEDDPRPSLIVCRTEIGYGLPTKQGTASAHGEPPGEDELNAAKDQLGWPQQPRFFVPDEVREHLLAAGERGKKNYQVWMDLLAGYKQEYPDLAAQYERTLEGRLPEDLEAHLPEFPADGTGMATRASSGSVINALAPHLPEWIGGSADLTGSNKTGLKGEQAFTVDARANRYIHFGVREHAMASSMSGMALHGGVIPYGGTFLVFSDYLRPALRLAAMMELRVIYVFTHDSIGLGEDGPTHQPIEQLASLRAIPNLTVIRPADANEVAQAWLCALQHREGPTALALTRQAVPTLDRAELAPAQGLSKGAYALADLGDGEPVVLLMASGSEVRIILEAGRMLAQRGVPNRVISFPSWELFEEQEDGYIQDVLPPSVALRIAVEAGVSQGWERWVGERGRIIALDRFGASAPWQEVYQHFGLTAERVIEQAEQMLDQYARLEVAE
jgi:transketolase